MLKGSYFAVNATPKTGTPLAYDIQIAVDDPLYLKGFIFLPENSLPIVVCSLDWIGISAKSMDTLKETIAKELKTLKENVEVHTTHFHDAPHSNLSAENVLLRYGWSDQALRYYDNDLLFRLCNHVKPVLQKAVANAIPVTHIGFGKAEVFEVASNRRLVGKTGKVEYTRYSGCKDSYVRSLPEGLIDPFIDLITLWNNDCLIASLSYYATHPMSYYRTAMCSSDFVGMARNMFTETVTFAPHIYFNGAGGNITAGKYNDGEKKNRYELAIRLFDGMKRAFENTRKEPVQSFCYKNIKMKLPIDERLSKNECIRVLSDKTSQESEVLRASRKLSWYEWCEQTTGIDISSININNIKILHMPGELFVEYQLYAKQKNPLYNICMAAYGEYGTGYIGVKKAYYEGGYETNPAAVKVSEDSEQIIKECIDELIKS